MDQHVEDANLAPMKATAQKIASTFENFLQNNIYGILMWNVTANVITKMFGLCVILCTYLWKTWHDQQKKNREALQQIERSTGHNSDINRELDEVNDVIDNMPGKELVGSELKQNQNEGSSPAVPGEEQSIGGQGTADEGSSSEPHVEERSLCTGTTAVESIFGDPIVSIQKPRALTKELCEVTLTGIFPKDDKYIDLVKELMKGLGGQKVDVNVRDLQGSRILETSVRVRLDEGLLQKARNIVEEGAKIDKDFTLQIESWGVYYYDPDHSGSPSFSILTEKAPTIRTSFNSSDSLVVSPVASTPMASPGEQFLSDKRVVSYKLQENHKGVVLYKLQENQVPKIFSAEYAAGVLRIYGIHLKGADIKAATSSKNKKLITVTYEKICDDKVDMLTCKDLLPETNLRNLYVYAINPVQVKGGRKINVMSSSVKIDDIHLKKALRDWLPSTVIVIFVARQLWLSTKPLWNAASAFYSEAYWTLSMLIIIFSTLLLPPRTEQWISEKLGSLSFTLSRLKEYVGSLGRSGLDSRESQEVQESQVLTVKTKKPKPPPVPPRSRPPEPTRTRDLSTDGEEELASESEGRSEGTAEFAFKAQGETILVTPLQWEWESFDLVRGKDRKPGLKMRSRVQPESGDVADPFRVIYENLAGAPWPERVYVHIKSKALLEVVEKLLPNTKQTYISFSGDEVGIKGRILFLARDKLKDELGRYTMRTDGEKLKHKLDRYLISTDVGTPTRTDYQLQRQLEPLVGFLEKEFAETSVRHERMDRQGCVSWDMLWTFLTPGEEVVYKCSVSDQEVCGMVEKVSYAIKSDSTFAHQIDSNNANVKLWHLSVNLRVYDYNCKTFEPYANIVRTIDEFEGESAFHALDVYPLRFPGKPGVSEKHFLNQGSTFGELSTKAKCRYMHYTGIMFRMIREEVRGSRGQLMKDKQVVREKANGRVMIDLASFAKMNPSDNKLGNAKPPYAIMYDSKVVEIDISEDPNRRFAPCIVYGFSFQLKKWGAFSVCGFDEIKRNVQAWDELVMDGVLKRMTEVLVGDYLKPYNLRPTGLDNISGKGDSCIVLCYGPPGTGKTLTAEALADKYRAPLWAMSVSELGITPDYLESQLVNIFDVAQSWHALLLLDEADIYLERRSGHVNLSRNALTGIFLRQLEYYKGLLFLTTNRLSSFDDAFCSRITLFLRYETLDSGQRKQIWRNFLKHTKLAADEMDEIVQKVSAYKLNGRQIRNVIQNAQNSARSITEGSKFGDLVIQSTEIMDKSVASIA